MKLKGVEKRDYKFDEVVRGKEPRKKLRGFTCPKCVPP